MVRFFPKKFIYLFIFALTVTPLISLGISYYFINSGEDDFLGQVKISNGDFSIDLSETPEIDYGTLNDMWYDSKIEMLIIAPDDSDFIDALEPLANWKNEKGVKTIVLSNFSSYEGADDAEKIRNMIKSYHETENIQWVLLAGDAADDLIPIRKVFNPDTDRWANRDVELVNEDYKPTDFYYADLSGSWDNDNDGNWGEAPQDNAFGLDEISWTPEVYVGRFPAGNANELEIMVNKTLQYEMSPEIGPWMNNMLLAGGISNYVDLPEDPDGEDEARLTEYIWKNYVISEMNFTHLFRTFRFTPEIPPLPNEDGPLTSFETKFNEGYSTVIFAGHGAYNKLADAAGTIYRSSDAISASNTNMPSLFYADACTTAPYDLNNYDNNIGEILIKKDRSGAIGFIGGLRVTWYFTEDENLEMINRGNAKLFWQEFFQEKKFQQGKALYDSKVSYMNSNYFTSGASSMKKDYNRKNVLTYCLLGDPEVDIYTNIPKIAKNPFIGQIYGGQLVTTTLQDISGEIVPYGRVHLRTLDGKYRTVYADIDGNVKFRVPNYSLEKYNISITGHNLIPTKFSFETNPDHDNPELLEIYTTPKNPAISDTTYLNVEARDNYSGIESVFLYISNNNFQNYSYFKMSNEFQENENLFEFDLGNLKSDEYSYFLVVRDYANNTKTFQNESFKFTIAAHLIDYIFPISVILITGIMGFSIFLTYKGIRKYSEMLRKIDENL